MPLDTMLKRQTSGSVVCPSCGRLVGVRDDRCLSCGRWNPGLWGYAPLLSRLGRDFGFVPLVIGGCGILFVLTLLYDPQRVGGQGFLHFMSPAPEALFLYGASGALPVFGAGRWWSVLSAAWLHGSLLHIFFNMIMIRRFAPPVADGFGVGRLVIIYAVSSAAGFLLSSFMGLLGFLPQFLRGATTLTIGASAPLFGLVGALVLYDRRTGSRTFGSQLLQFAVIWVVLGFVMAAGTSGIVRFDNWAHVGGFLGGYGAARWLDPLRPEQPAHILGGLVALVAMVGSLVVSLLHGLAFLR